ncbi:ATP-binding protein [Streptomyces sp. H27-C3]|uniref:ATP-binding protein n=1 Tax=Streptomyces sp. H27-C3 TaxID=3046305 RepID=UPI0024BB4CFC|nr:ATP-binding protein [Streptomyces sp. H27-C3]MDJ0463892.1 ATP-binding protein [Streptomyces sp. H27-C3]
MTVPRIRTIVRAVLEGWRVSAAVTESLLLVSELVANAVQHAGAVTDRLHVSMALGCSWLQLEVLDGDPVLPCTGREVDVDAESGRGLLIVHLLIAEMCGEVTALPRGCGKALRVRIPVPREAPVEAERALG